MKKTRLGTLLFFFILLSAAFLRLYRLPSIPPGVNRDEASIGFTAYSILKTGRDEYGKVYPLSFQSFGDWKLPLYIYTTVPFVALLGPNELAVRLPSALAGISTVAVVYFLVVELTGSSWLALLSMAVLTISPWHLHLSRVESESNVAVLFMSLGLLFFLKSIHRKKPKLLIPSAICFALPYFTYHGNHISTTLIALGVAIIYWKDIPKKRMTWIAASIFLGLVAIILSQTLHGADATKISGISIFGDPTVVHEKIELLRTEHKNIGSIQAMIFHNRIFYAIETIARNYINTFSPDFLFIQGGTNGAHNIQNFGNMYLIEAPFLLFGILVLILKSAKSGSTSGRKEYALLLWWLLAAPIASSITKDAPHTNRAFALFPILPITVALGIAWVIEQTKKNRIALMTLAVMTLYLINGAVYIDRYYMHFPRDESINWGAGYKALNEVVTSTTYENKHVVMANPEASPYIYFLFYSKYDPEKYFDSVKRYDPTEDAFVHVSHFGRFDFRQINWGDDIKLPNTLLISPPKEVPQDIIDDRAHAKTTIILPNGDIQFIVVETK